MFHEKYSIILEPFGMEITPAGPPQKNLVIPTANPKKYSDANSYYYYY